MAYLITHISIFLLFAMLLGLVLGWLLWGYTARQRSQEVESLREQIADMHLVSTRTVSMPERRAALTERQGALIEGDLPDAVGVAEKEREGSFVEPMLTLAAPIATPIVAAQSIVPALAPPPIAPDLEAQVKDSRIQHLEQQLREMEGAKDRLPLLQADLNNAIAGKTTAENRFNEAKSEFEARSSNLLAQIRDFENAAGAWDRKREELERKEIAKDKELSAAKAQLRDLQNSQRPQTASPEPLAPNALAIELAELRERYHKSMKDRDSLATELESLKEQVNSRASDSLQLTRRLHELENVSRSKEATFHEQVLRIESLLWRVAELEPFAAAAPQMEENLKRQESEIAGHVAMHSEALEQLAGLQKRIAELETAAAGSEESKEQSRRLVADLRAAAAKKDEVIAGQAAAQEARAKIVTGLQLRIAELETAAARSEESKEQSRRLVADLRAAAAKKDEVIAGHVTAQEARAKVISALQSRISDLEAFAAKASELEKSLSERDAASSQQVQALTQEHERRLGELQGQVHERVSELEAQTKVISGLQAQLAELNNAAQKAAQLEKTLADKESENRGLLAAHGEVHREMQGWKDYSAQLQQVAAKVPSLESLLNDREAEIHKLREGQSETEARLTAMEERLNALQTRLKHHQERAAELEPLAARVPEVEQQLSKQEEESVAQLRTLADKHQAELTRLKVNSAQRLRRLRQGITSFKS